MSNAAKIFSTLTDANSSTVGMALYSGQVDSLRALVSFTGLSRANAVDGLITLRARGLVGLNSFSLEV